MQYGAIWQREDYFRSEKGVKEMKLQNITDGTFQKYGRIIEGCDFSDLLKAMGDTPCPADEVIYVPSDAELEKLSEFECLRDVVYGGLPVQIGYCNGSNRKLNAVEYHRSSEVDIAVSDLILLLGCQQDIEPGFTYETSRVEAFFVPAGTAVELYATTLHYAPCSAAPDSGFRCVVVLPRDTNLDLETVPEPVGEARLITARNKWLIAHEDAGIEGAFCGLKGKNINLNEDL